MEQVDSSNHKFSKTEVEVRTEIIISIAIRTDIGQIVKTGDNTDKIQVDLDMSQITGEETSEKTCRALTDRIVEEYIEAITEVKVLIETGTGLEKGHFPEVITTIEIGVQAIIGPGQDQVLCRAVHGKELKILFI